MRLEIPLIAAICVAVATLPISRSVSDKDRCIGLIGGWDEFSSNPTAIELYHPINGKCDPSSISMSVNDDTFLRGRRAFSGCFLPSSKQMVIREGYGDEKQQIPIRIDVISGNITQMAIDELTIDSTSSLIDGVCYSFGGVIQRPFHPINRTYTASTDSNGWIRSIDLPFNRYAMASLTFNEEIIVGGGFNISGNGLLYPQNSVLAYSPVTRQWRQLASMNVGRASYAMASLDNRTIIACGGEFLYPTSCEMYDSLLDEWRPLNGRPNSGPTGRFHLQMVTFNGVIYAIGGVNSINPPVEYYDVDKDEWRSDNIRFPIVNRYGFMAVVL